MTRSYIRLEPYSSLPRYGLSLHGCPHLTCPPATSFSLKPDSLGLSKRELVIPTPALVLTGLSPGSEQMTQCSLV